MLTRLLLAGALGLTLATVSLDAHALGRGVGDSGRGHGGGGAEASLLIQAGRLLIREGTLDLLHGDSEGLSDFAEAQDLFKEAASETRSRR